jgi:hypothetical protein
MLRRSSQSDELFDSPACVSFADIHCRTVFGQYKMPWYVANFRAIANGDLSFFRARQQ